MERMYGSPEQLFLGPKDTGWHLTGGNFYLTALKNKSKSQFLGVPFAAIPGKVKFPISRLVGACPGPRFSGLKTHGKLPPDVCRMLGVLKKNERFTEVVIFIWIVKSKVKALLMSQGSKSAKRIHYILYEYVPGQHWFALHQTFFIHISPFSSTTPGCFLSSGYLN